MKLNKCVLSVALSVLALQANAQTSHRVYDDNRIYTEESREKSVLTRGLVAPNYPFMHNGTWYAETKEFLPGELLYNNRLYRGIDMNIDACKNLLVVKLGIITATDRKYVDYAVIGGQKYVNLQYHDRVQDAPEGFCKAVFEDDFCFYSLVSKTIHNAPGNHNGEDIGYYDSNYKDAVKVGSKSITVDTFFAYSRKCYVVKDGVCRQVRNRFALLKMFDKPTAKKLRKYADSTGLNLETTDLESYARLVLTYWRDNLKEGTK